MIVRKSQREIERMRQAGMLVAQAFQLLEKTIEPGITTEELDGICEKFIRSNHAVPAFKGYRGFPNSICSSINEEVVHGIPGKRRLKSGDIISIDVGIFYQGYYADSARTFPCGGISKEARKLMELTEMALYAGIDKARIGNRLSDISNSIQVCVEKENHSVVRDFVGHGIGTSMHEEPQVPNFGLPGWGPRLKQGMTFAIEPMVNMGTHEVYVSEDKWTVKTLDNSWSAHFEHTVAVTINGPEILTKL